MENRWKQSSHFYLEPNVESKFVKQTTESRGRMFFLHKYWILWIFSLAVLRRKPELLLYSLGHHRQLAKTLTFCNISVITEDIYLSMCSLSKEQSILSKGDKSKYIFFFSELCPFFDLDFLAHLSTTCSGGAIVTGHRPASVRPSICPSVR